MGTTTIVAVIVGVYIVLDRIGALERLKLTRPSADAAASELNLADRAIDRLRKELANKDAKIAELTVQRTNEPVLALVSQVAEICAKTLEKLASFNGSLANVEQGLGEAAEGMKALTGLIAELHDIPMNGRNK